MLGNSEGTTEMEISQEPIVTVHDRANLELVDKNLKKRASSSPEKIGAECPVEDTYRPDESPENDKEAKRIRSSPTLADEAGSESPSVPEKLEVPSTELQYIQKQVLVEKLMGLTSPSSKENESMDVQMVDDTEDKSKDNKTHSRKPPFRVPQPPKQDFRKTFKMRSFLLDRVKSFLPEMKNANEELLRLPDPSQLSLESDSDRDEMDNAVPGPSGSSKKPATTSSKAGEIGETKTYVEMNLALVAQSDSDTSSDDDETRSVIKKGAIKGLPILHKGPSGSPKKPTTTLSKTREIGETKTFVKMNLALVARSDSDTSSDDDETRSVIKKATIKGLPVLPKRDDLTSPASSTKAATPSESLVTSDDKVSAADITDSKENSEKKSLITELN